MPGPDTVAEGGGLAILLTLTLLAFLGWMVSRGMGYVWKYTIGAFLNIIAGFLRINVWFVHWDIGGPVRSVANDVEKWFMDQAAKNEQAMGYFWHATAETATWMASETVALARDTWHLGYWLKNVFTPTYVEGATHLWKSLTHSTAAKVGQIETRVAHQAKAISSAIAVGVPAAVSGAVRPIDREIAKHKKAIGAIAGAVAGGLAIPGGLTGEIGALKEAWGFTKRNLHLHNLRISRLEALLGAAGMAAVMANALGLPNWRCITRGNLGRVSRALCGLPGNFLNDLLGLIADFFILENVCTVIPYLETAASDVGVPLVTLLTDVGAGLCQGSIGAAKPLPGPQATAPPLYTGPSAIAV